MFTAIVLIGLIVALISLWDAQAKLRAQIDILQMRMDVLATSEADDAPTERTPRVAASVPPPDRRVIVTDVAPQPAPPPAVFDTAIEPARTRTVAPTPAVPDWIGTAVPEEAMPAAPRVGFEELFGRRLPIWGGGITLAVAGMLIVKYSIDAGLLSPLVRVIFGLLFGTALIGAAELALRFAERVDDVRVRQALSGAGLATLYASVLIAANLYHLISPFPAFLGLAGVTALAMGLSLRFGAPSALLGLVGGLAAPALVGSTEPNIPLLVTYLAIAVGGLCALSRNQRWMGLGISALFGGFGWGGLLVLGGALDNAASLSVGTYLLVIGVALPALIVSNNMRALVRFAGSAMATVQIAVLVAQGGFALLDWSLFGLISIAMLWMSRREAGLARLPILGLVVMTLLLMAWPHPPTRDFAVVLIVGALLYALPVLQKLWSDGANEIEAAQIAGVAIAALALPMLHFYDPHGGNDRVFALIAFAAALAPAGAAAFGWRCETRKDDARFVLLITTCATLMAAVFMLALEPWAWAPAVGGVALATLLLGHKADDPMVEYAAWGFAGLGLLLMTANTDLLDEIARASGLVAPRDLVPAPICWGGVALIAGLFAWQAKIRPVAKTAQAVSAVLTYGAIAQIVPIDALPLIPAIGLLVASLWSRTLRVGTLTPAIGSLLTLSVLWAMWPIGQWSDAAVRSLGGHAILLPALPTMIDVGLRLIAPALLTIGALYIGRVIIDRRARLAMIAVASLFAGIAAHIAYKHVFALTDHAAFVHNGFAERTLWEALAFAAAVTAWRLDRRLTARILGAAGIAHFVGYGLLLHNPLWTEQAVGTLPVVNWLLPAFGLPMAMLWLWSRADREGAARIERPRSIMQIMLILIFAFSLLRQIVHGTILSMPGVTEAEDITRSLLAIVIAVGFLGWGITRSARDWRIASLLLMLGAVGKVFLFDAAGLDGLARIGSFVALGLSLIGIGWLYSRFLKPDAITGR